MRKLAVVAMLSLVGCVSDPNDPKTTMGPVISAAQRARCEKYVSLAQEHGQLFATRRNREDIDVQEERGRATLQTLLTGERINTLLKKRHALRRPQLAASNSP